LVRQLISAVLWSLFVGAGAGGLMCVIALSENLAGHIVDLDGGLDLGFLAQVFLTWFTPVAATTLGFGLLVILVLAVVRWASDRWSNA